MSQPVSERHGVAVQVVAGKLGEQPDPLAPGVSARSLEAGTAVVDELPLDLGVGALDSGKPGVGSQEATSCISAITR